MISTEGERIFRNIAFYRYPVEPPLSWRLKDLGSDFLPEFPDKYHEYGDVPKAYLKHFFKVIVLYALLFNEKGYEKPHSINMLLRFIEYRATGALFRFSTYVSTSIPGANEACFGKWENIECPKPITWMEILTRKQSNYNGRYKSNNCGDLVFSGHTYWATLLTLLICKYNRKVFRISKKASYCVNFTASMIWLCNGLFVLMARNHYTIDVVVASYFAPLLWYWFERKVHPNDLCPSEAE